VTAGATPKGGSWTGRLIELGAASAIFHAILGVLSQSFRYGGGHADRPIPEVLGLLMIAWAAYAVALAIVLRPRRPSNPDSSARRTEFLVVIGFSVLFRLILLGSSPIQEIDYYRYLWDGRVLLSGLDPYQLAPAELDRLGAAAEPGSALSRTWELSRASEPLRTIFERIHHREVPTIYPPVAQAVFALSARLTPIDAPLWVHVIIFKALLVGFDLGVVLALAGLLVRLGKPASWCLAYGWCPLALKEVANTGHLDAIAVCLTLLATLAITGVSGRERDRAGLRFGLLAAVGLALGTLGKSYPLVLTPLFGAFLAARLRWRVLWATLAFAGVLAIGYAPFLVGRALSAADRNEAETEHTPWSGVSTFLSQWEKNDFLFMIVYENVRVPEPKPQRAGLLEIAGGEPAGPDPDRWFAVVPRSVRAALRERLDQVLPSAITSKADPAFLLTQALMGTVVVGIVFGWAWAVYRRPEAERLAQACGLVLVWGWLLAPTGYPWYLTWSLPFFVFDRRRSWFLLTALALGYYLRFFVEYQAIEAGPGAMAAALDRFDHGIVWAEYGPFFLVLLWEQMRLASGRRTGVSSRTKV